MNGPRPRIRTVLLLVNLVILILPLFGIQALKLYESELIRQTEASLISQGVYIREQFKEELLRRLPDPNHYGVAAPTSMRLRLDSRSDPYEPLLPQVDMAAEVVRPPALEAEPAKLPADAAANEAGDRISPLLRRSQRFSLAGIRIVDWQGVVVASSRGELGQSLYSREEVQRALTGDTAVLIRERQAEDLEPPLAGISRGGRIRVFLGLPVLLGDRIVGAIVLSRTPIDIQKALYLNRLALGRFAVGMLLIVLTVSILTATTISRPIAALIAQTKEVKHDVRKATLPLARPGSKEVMELSEAVASMARTLSERADYIRTFAQNVSHEFKTPLASFHGVLELMRDHGEAMSPPERGRFLEMLESDATRMRKLVDRLLELAKADVSTPNSGRTELKPLLATLLQRHRDQGLNVELLAPPPAELTARMAPEILDSVLTNLLDNAAQHGGEGVKVQLRVIPPDGATAFVQIVIEDDGPGISQANLTRVFTPFFTTARERGGTGLGLSIVRSLVESHGGSVDLSERSGQRGVQVILKIGAAFEK